MRTHGLLGGGVGALAMVFACLCPANAEGDQVVATIDQSAVVTAVAAPSVQARPADQPAPLPKEFANRRALKLSVQLEPIRGSGTGASLEVGGAEIR